MSYNRLKEEKSSYLLQHKDNPIHWYSWGPEALQAAKDKNLPIFLSVGYSSCHWCHVMAHESFSNKEVADFLNEKFISIKVDREEFPDIDTYYQGACQLFTGRGGWPLSAFLLPDTKPFFAGTYFPLVKKGETTTFPELLKELDRAFQSDNEMVVKNAEKVNDDLIKGPPITKQVEFEGHFPHPMSVLEAVEKLKDNDHGGYGAAPKFPSFSFYEWAIEQLLEGIINKEAGEHIIKTMESMLMGGIYDQARGGIHRYSTDKEWSVPHFEKMLYDQTGLLKTLSKLSLIYSSPLVFDALVDTMNYLETEMLSDEGYFFSAQDADSEGVEGLYFTFTEEEFEDSLNKILDTDEFENIEADQVKKWFKISSQGQMSGGLNVIQLDPQYKDFFYTPENWRLVRAMKLALRETRSTRIPPQTDTKGVASWNFMLITSLCDVIQYCTVDSIRHQAHKLLNRCVEGIHNTFLVTTPDKKMLIRHTNTKNTSLPYFEDYVLFAESQLRLFELTGNQVFKENLLDILNHINLEFVTDEGFSTRGKETADYELYPNILLDTWDSSFRSVPSTYIHLLRRAYALSNNEDYLNIFTKHKDKMINEILSNPLNSGEGLRAFTYPHEIYRTLTIPFKWTEDPKYHSYIAYFLPRFVINFWGNEAKGHEKEVGPLEEKWVIASNEKVELQGVGIENFVETLVPQKGPATEQQNQ
jgi:uncharacterized protein YyaL (SSP411 family)